jgi:hypothetical protein
MPITVDIPDILPAGQPFPVELTSTDLVTMSLTLTVDGTQVQFGLIVGHVERAPALVQTVDVDAHLACTIVKWGTPAVGAVVVMTAKDDDDQVSDSGVVSQ